MVLVSAVARQRLVFHVTATYVHIKFILDTAIDDLEWKNPIDFGMNQKVKMTDGGHFVKYDEQACARHNFFRNAPINFIFDVAIDLP